MTNLHQLTIKKDGLKEMEEGLYRPLPSSTSQSSLDGVAAPLPRGRENLLRGSLVDFSRRGSAPCQWIESSFWPATTRATSVEIAA